MKILFLLFSVLISYSCFAQEQLDTIFYDSNWKGCTKTFATYYRIMTIPTDEYPQKQFRDYYITRELRREGKYICVDPKDDHNSIFDGGVKSYYKNGNVLKEWNWENSHPIGDMFEFYENGNVKIHQTYNNRGNIYGKSSFFNELGNLTRVIEYHEGIPNTYFKAYNQYGSMGQYDTETKQLVPEAVYPTTLKTKMVKGRKYFYYDDKNGIYLSITIDAVKHYGKYYRISVSIFNNTNTSILFDPTRITANGRYFKVKKGKVTQKYDGFNSSVKSHTEYGYNASQGKSKNLQVWTYADYANKVRDRQQWDKALMAVAQGLTTFNAGYSTSQITTNSYGSAYGYSTGSASAFGSGGYAYGSYNSNAYVSGSTSTLTTITTYDATAAAIAQERAAYNVSTYAVSLEADLEAINQNYLRPTTLDPQTQIAGYFLVSRDNPKILDLTIPINGIAYQFHLAGLPN